MDKVTDLETSPLLPRHVFNELMTEVASRIEAVKQGPSAYQTFAELASIFMELGNRLALLIYRESGVNGSQRLACAQGCSVCCHVPSEVRPGNHGNFSMSYLDMISLVENYAEIKVANPSLNLKAITAVEEAKRTGALQPCPHLTANGNCGCQIASNRDPSFACNVDPSDVRTPVFSVSSRGLST